MVYFDPDRVHSKITVLFTLTPWSKQRLWVSGSSLSLTDGAGRQCE
jgi:hypothetical protein